MEKKYLAILVRLLKQKHKISLFYKETNLVGEGVKKVSRLTLTTKYSIIRCLDSNLRWSNTTEGYKYWYYFTLNYIKLCLSVKKDDREVLIFYNSLLDGYDCWDNEKNTAEYRSHIDFFKKICKK